MKTTFDCGVFGQQQIRMPDYYVHYFNAHADMQRAIIAGEEVPEEAQKVMLLAMVDMHAEDKAHGYDLEDDYTPWRSAINAYTKAALPLRFNGVPDRLIWPMWCAIIYQVQYIHERGELAIPPSNHD